MVAIFAEPGYGSSVWGKNLYRSLVRQLRQKRIPFCEITDFCPADTEAVFLIGANLDWTTAAIARLNRAGHQPILLCNQYERIPGCLYSCVCSDVNASMRAVLEELKAQNRTRVALYGMGSSSIADVSRASSLTLNGRDSATTPSPGPHAIACSPHSIHMPYAGQVSFSHQV